LVDSNRLGSGQVQRPQASGRCVECRGGGHKNDSGELGVDGWPQGLCAQHVSIEVGGAAGGQEGADGRVGAAARRGAIKACQVDLVGGGQEDVADNVDVGVDRSCIGAVCSDVPDVCLHHLSLVHSEGRVACQGEAARGRVQVLAAWVGDEGGRRREGG